MLWRLLSDPRDLNLRRFTYGALAEFDSPQATDILFDAINKSDNEPDRTVTESAVIALTVRTKPLCRACLPRKKNFRTSSSATTWTTPGKSLKSGPSTWLPQGKHSGGSIESAVRTYFIPALEPQSASAAPGRIARPECCWKKSRPRTRLPDRGP